MNFYFILKAFFLLDVFKRYLFDFFSQVGTRLVKKAKVNIKIYDIIDSETRNYNTNSSQYFKNLRQSDNQIWYVYRIQVQKSFS